MTDKRTLSESFLHLGLGATAVPQPEFSGMEWYEGYGARHGADGAEGRLVSQYEFTEDWTSWEMHPHGSEVVICTAGQMTLIQEIDGGTDQTVMLEAGEYIVNPPGVWHTANVEGTATAIFITAGEGTQHRPR
ncbi:cupin domain-containing protein [Qipengyuania marisflavi]|uniref:Cupin domain-containing protein n=1 Tax=Qipengyuania marisflavi TaxID=2486356 RepID=A0A5S3P5Q9_9SPHN|nr:cupin domain-containing protein [Qipengyuania marisflavi]TMM48380.1 cupin domain-containing protein [Qipengyuania marisflavi]